MIIVPDTEHGLKKAADLAMSLTKSRQIQAWDLSDEVAGVTLMPFPGMAGVVVERGGHAKYLASISDQFVALGYKVYVAPPPVAAKPADPPKPFVAPAPAAAKPGSPVQAPNKTQGAPEFKE